VKFFMAKLLASGPFLLLASVRTIADE